MNSFVKMVNAPVEASTANGMVALNNTGDNLVDLFFKVGASRNMSDEKLSSLFAKAIGDNGQLAVQLALWARDVRGGAGERRAFRVMMQYLEKNHPKVLIRLLPYISEFGRWDDILIFEDKEVEAAALNIYGLALRSGNGLAAKWAPRKGLTAVKLRNVMGLSPKQYRKMIVGLSDTVEQKMCAREWDKIEFGKLPSIAAKQYQKAFMRHAMNACIQYKNALLEGKDKINASAIFPHDVLVSLKKGEILVAEAQWNSLPNYMSDKKILPVVDVSGSMNVRLRNSNVSAMDVAISLGLYISEKNTGAFNGVYCTFSDNPELVQLKGSLKDRYNQLNNSNWGMSTNLEAVFNEILKRAKDQNVPQEDMPEIILMVSDMQFNQCVSNSSNSAFEMIRAAYEQAEYKMPTLVFWNIVEYDNVPVEANKKNVMLISGFNPSILTSILKTEKITPFNVMLNTINAERYQIKVW